MYFSFLVISTMTIVCTSAFISRIHDFNRSLVFENDSLDGKKFSDNFRVLSKLDVSSSDEDMSTFTPIELEYVEYTHASVHLEQMHDAPVILLHGLLGSKRNFSTVGSSLSRQLSRTKRRILALDLRNHGESKSHNWRDSMSYVEMASDVIGFLDSKGIGKAVIVGHSMGGKVAQALALLFPERVEGLIVLDIAPVVYDKEKDGSWKAVSTIIDALTNLPTENISKRELDSLLKEYGVDDVSLRSFVLTNIEEDRKSKQIRWKINLDAIANNMHVLAGFDLKGRDENSICDNYRYNGDAFFINGGASRFIRSTHMKTISDYFPNNMLTTVRGAGHWIHAEAPDDTVALLKKYLER